MSAAEPLTIGIDIGGTSLRAGLVRSDGSLVSAITDVPRSDDIVEQLGAVADDLLVLAADAAGDIVAAGVAIPGSVDPRTGRVGSAPTAPALIGLDPRDIKLGPVGRPAICNDANAALTGEWRFGAAVGRPNCIGLFSGTGVGGGAIVDGRLMTGTTGVAGEMGHLVVDPAGPACPCGGRGCLEQFGSGTAIAAWYGARSASRPAGAAQVAELARAGDALAVEAFAVAGHSLGIAVASLANVFNPGIVVIGGGVTAAWDLLEDSLHAAVRTHAMPLARRQLGISVGALGRAAGVIGAAVSAWRA
jgi:glucokinase